MRILGLCGRRKSGKSRAADMVIKLTGSTPYPFKKVSFADPLRLMFANEKGIEPESLKDNYTKELYRKELIEYSQKVKAEDPLFFVNALFENYVDEADNIVIDDVRFIEELAAIKKRGGIIYKVEASNTIRKARGWEYNADVDENLSETELGDLSAHTMAVYGGILFNNGSEEQLRKDVRQVLVKHFVST